MSFCSQRGSLSRGFSVQEVSVQGSLSRGLSSGVLCPEGPLSRRSLSRGLCPGGSLYREVSIQGGLCPGDLSQGDPPMVQSTWYTSYWNAFLLTLNYSRHCLQYQSSDSCGQMSVFAARNEGNVFTHVCMDAFMHGRGCA